MMNLTNIPFNLTINAAYIIPTIILAGSLVTDLRTRKIYNKWVVVSIILAVANSFYFFGWDGLQQGALGGGLALIMTLPLVLLGALGAGDMKILFAFGLATTYSGVFSVLIFSIFWGAAIGILMAIRRGKGKTLVKNTFKILTAQPRDVSTFQTMPYSIALFLGWITFLVCAAHQGSLI
jgi:prepilin peptidase CpaA